MAERSRCLGLLLRNHKFDMRISSSIFDRQTEASKGSMLCICLPFIFGSTTAWHRTRAALMNHAVSMHCTGWKCLSQIYLFVWIHGLRYQYIIYFCVKFFYVYTFQCIHISHTASDCKSNFHRLQKSWTCFFFFALDFPLLSFHCLILFLERFSCFVDCCAPLLTYLLEIWNFVPKLFFYTFLCIHFFLFFGHAVRWPCFCHFVPQMRSDSVRESVASSCEGENDSEIENKNRRFGWEKCSLSN